MSNILIISPLHKFPSYSPQSRPHIAFLITPHRQAHRSRCHYAARTTPRTRPRSWLPPPLPPTSPTASSSSSSCLSSRSPPSCSSSCSYLHAPSRTRLPYRTMAPTKRACGRGARARTATSVIGICPRRIRNSMGWCLAWRVGSWDLRWRSCRRRRAMRSLGQRRLGRRLGRRALERRFCWLQCRCGLGAVEKCRPWWMHCWYCPRVVSIRRRRLCRCFQYITVA
ncbi:hypothetical protein K505DRAFT_149911 [Melanomma pulvis-pyrius CBS 109.77]|uniref:Uncharacterized protein n=1 Tax=Melanomma pulvis-pyrius CBS 109.77 TaxID=1314802 RepID=A0A6A6XLK8_9PLEO|nr:hypothetical protein K505DRAFT_149911 [Melanomma pulvis-pyrius CBS 109.77]